MPFSDTLLIALIGATVAGIIIPIIRYFIPRWYNRWRTSIRITERQENGYKVYTLIVENSSWATLKNLYVHVTINNDKNDIIKDSRIKIFCPDTKVEFGKLSWSKNINGQNYPNTDINQGQTEDVNFVRHHHSNPNNAYEVASEQGFFDENSNNKARTVLKANPKYKFRVKLTGDNIAPKEKTFTLPLQL